MKLFEYIDDQSVKCKFLKHIVSSGIESLKVKPIEDHIRCLVILRGVLHDALMNEIIIMKREVRENGGEEKSALLHKVSMKGVTLIRKFDKIIDIKEEYAKKGKYIIT